MEETVTSILAPGLENGGRVAVTITEAMFFAFKVLSLIDRPCRLRMLAMVAIVKPFFKSSPVPCRPTTRP
jgi:hypothetical protein